MQMKTVRHALTMAMGLVLLSACSQDDKAARRRAAGPAPSYAALAKVASASAGASLFHRCAACHTINAGSLDRNGPNLFGVVGARIGHHSKRFGYTAALQRVDGAWTPERLNGWLADPRRFAPGTSMSIDGLADPLDRADVIAYLETQR